LRAVVVQFWAREYVVVRERKKVLVGRVVSNKMQKTVVVAVQSLRRDRLYQRMVRHTKKFLVHDEHASSSVGDMVRIRESRPISKRKHFVVTAIVERIADRGKRVSLPVTPAPIVGIE
jgi:small subunit ribosomal protein S17